MSKARVPGRALAVTVGAMVLLPATAAARDITVMSWNVKAEWNHVVRWARVIEDKRPDVVGMQEICVSQARELARRLRRAGVGYRLTLGSASYRHSLRYRGCRRHGVIPGRGAFGQAMLTRGRPRAAVNRKYPVVAGTERRAYMAVTLTLGRQDVRVFDSHLDFHPDARIGQARILAAAARRHPRAVVIGDFNDKPGSPTAAVFAPDFAGATDTFPGTFPSSKPSCAPGTPPSTPCATKIDFILTRGVTQFGPTVAVVAAGDASDHYPLMTGVHVEDAPTVGVLADCRNVQVRPRAIVYGCADANVGADHLRWRSWGMTRAVARGTFYANDCRPDCADGHVRRSRATVVLSRPRACPDGHRVFTRVATRTRGRTTGGPLSQTCPSS